jgi:hypothetical protein
VDNLMGDTLLKLISVYADAVGRYGPDSDEVHRLRDWHADNAEFLNYADALDRIKRNLGGSGIDDRREADGSA